MIETVRAEDLRETVVTATLDVPVEHGKGLVFCSTFQLAWNELRTALGGSVALEGDPPLAAALSSSEVSRDDVDDASFLAGAGDGPKFLAALRADLEKKFGESQAAAFGLPPSLKPLQLLAYAYLSKNLRFSTPFAVEREFGLRFDGTLLSCFGLWKGAAEETWEKCEGLVVVHDYADDQDFVVELVTEAHGDRLLLARVAPKATLLATAASVMNRAKSSGSFVKRLTSSTRLKRDDEFKVPMVRLDVLKSYAELTPRKIVGWPDNVLEEARQAIRFGLDEKGAILRSSAMLMVARGGPIRRRRLVFDGPFFLLLVREGRSLPYFAMWVATPELLEKASN